MRKRRIILIAVLIALCYASIPHTAHAYIDPGTTGNVFAILAPFVTLFMVFLGFLFRPIREFFKSIIRKLRGGHVKESPIDDERPVPDDPLDKERSGEETGGKPEN